MRIKLKKIFVFILIFSGIYQKNYTIHIFADKPKISVIVPVYNTELYIDDCLNSIIGQSFSDLEIIVVNDGSTDKSLELIEAFARKDKRIKVLNQENKGGAAARNAGVKAAVGEYIAFVDSDDTIHPDTYKISYEKAKETNADILMFGETKFTSPNETYYDGFKALTIPCSIFLWNKLYKHTFLLEHNFKIPENIKCYHDETFNSIVFPKAKSITCIKNKFYHYRKKRSGSIQTSSNLQKKSENILNATKYLCENFRKNNYVKQHGRWLLRKINQMVNRVIHKLNPIDQKFYTKALLEVMSNDIYNSDNIKNLTLLERAKLNSWIKYSML